MAETYRRFELRSEFIDEAAARAENLPLFENSHRGSDANLIGCIGELVFEHLLDRNGIDFESRLTSTTEDYALANGLLVDVKTKDRTVPPKRDYDNSIPLYNHEHQVPDFFFFVSLLRDRNASSGDICRFTHAFLMGGITYKGMEEKGKTWSAGETDPSNGTKFWTACLNVKMHQLMSVHACLDHFQEPSV